MVVGMLSAFLSAVMALVATDLKRVLAYSTVSQLGYMVYAVGAGGIFASQFHLFSHSVFKALLFLGAGAVIHSVGTRDMREMGGLGKQMPVVRAGLCHRRGCTGRAADLERLLEQRAGAGGRVRRRAAVDLRADALWRRPDGAVHLPLRLDGLLWPNRRPKSGTSTMLAWRCALRSTRWHLAR